MRALLTGVTGFVAGYLTRFLVERNIEVFGTTRGELSSCNIDGVTIKHLDLLKRNEITDLLNALKPDIIFHLAGVSSVQRSWSNPALVFEANVLSTTNLLEAVRASQISSRVKLLTVGSSEEYGAVPSQDMPIHEESVLTPVNPYGISKATIAMLAKTYYKAYGIQTLHARPFNHIGPRQNLGFVTADFASQIVKIEKGWKKPVIRVGNLNSQRDFLDVRDVVAAYYELIVHGNPGEVYNVCSSKPVGISDILNELVCLSNIEITVQIDSELFRPVDYPIYFGSNEKIMKDTRWGTTIQLQESLVDIMNYWREKE